MFTSDVSWKKLNRGDAAKEHFTFKGIKKETVVKFKGSEFSREPNQRTKFRSILKTKSNVCEQSAEDLFILVALLNLVATCRENVNQSNNVFMKIQFLHFFIDF